MKIYSIPEKNELLGDLIEPLLAADGSGIGYEIGVWNADTSVYLLNRFPGLIYAGVDPYLSWEEYGEKPLHASWQDGINHKLWFSGKNEAEAAYLQALKVYGEYGGRAKLYRQKSMEAVLSVPDDSIDFVYIDGNHFHDQVLRDISRWTRKVRPGGLIAGDDFNWCGDISNVGKAVNEFFGFNYSVMADIWFTRKH